MNDLDLTTDRSAYTDLIPKGHLILAGLQANHLREDVVSGLDALAALFFEENSDEDTLPVWLVKAYEEAACMGAWSGRFESTPTGVAS